MIQEIKQNGKKRKERKSDFAENLQRSFASKARAKSDKKSNDILIHEPMTQDLMSQSFSRPLANIEPLVGRFVYYMKEAKSWNYVAKVKFHLIYERSEETKVSLAIKKVKL